MHAVNINIRDVNIVFWQTGYRLLKTDFKLVIGFTDLHKNILYKENNYVLRVAMYIHAKQCHIEFYLFSRFSLNEIMNIVYTVCFMK